LPHRLPDLLNGFVAPQKSLQWCDRRREVGGRWVQGAAR
jgi:hypothetical protein